MVVDQLGNRELYVGLGADIATGLAFLEAARVQPFREQTVEIDGKRIYAMFQTYETEPASLRIFEAHKKYIDIQFIYRGVEVIRYAPAETLRMTTPYSDEKDVAFFDLAAGVDIEVPAGSFVILYPHEGHAPKIQAPPTVGGSATATVQKIVVKVAID